MYQSFTVCGFVAPRGVARTMKLGRAASSESRVALLILRSKYSKSNMRKERSAPLASTASVGSGWPPRSVSATVPSVLFWIR